MQRRKSPILKLKGQHKKALISVTILLIIFHVLLPAKCADGADATTYYANDYNVLNGTYLSGNVQASLQNVDSDYFVVDSSASATSASAYSPSAHIPFGQTAYVSGVTGDLVSDNGVSMVYRSYPTVTSAMTLYAHQETTIIGGNAYYITEPENPDLTGTTLSASMAVLGRQPLGRFVLPLIGMSSVPASAWTEFYRTWRTSDPAITYDACSSGNNGDGTASIAWTHVVGSGANRFIMIGISIRTVTVSVLNVTVGTQLATFLRSDINGVGVKGEIWYLANPNPGSKTVTVALSDISKASGGSVSYAGVSQTSPIDGQRGVSYSGQIPTISLTTTTDNDWIFSNLAISGAATVTSHLSGQTHRYYDIGTGGSGTSRAGSDGDDSPTTTAGSYAMSWNMSWYSDVIMQSVAIKPAPPPVGHIDTDVLILKSDGTVRATIANNVSDSANLTPSPTTLSGTYSWANYAIVDQTDYLEIDYYTEVTAATSGMVAFLRIDDDTLPLSEHTRIANVVLPDEYTAEVELTGTSNMYSWTQVEWTIDSSWTTGAAAVTVQLYDHNIDGYPTGGNGFISYTTNATPNTDETKTQTITTNPQHFRDATGNWKIKVKGVKTTNTPFDLEADLIQLRPTYLSEHAVETEFLFSSMTTNSPTELNFTVASEYDLTGVAVIVQVWNFSSSTYASGGQGYIKYVSSSANETTTLSISTNPRFYVSNGNAKIRIIGSCSTPIQYHQKTNLIALVYSYVNTYIHDVAIISVTPSTNSVFAGQVVNVAVALKNNGTAPETFDVTIFYNETLIETKTVTNLGIAEQRTLEFQWNTANLAEANYRMRAEASEVSGEVNKNNNSYTSSYLVTIKDQVSSGQFDWLRTLMYILPVPFVVLLLWFLGMRRKKNAGHWVQKKADTFSKQFGMTHNHMIGKKMLLEIDPASEYNVALSGFISEAKKSGEQLFIMTNKNSALHSVFSESDNVNFLLLTSKTHYPQQINTKETLLPESDLSVLLDSLVRVQKGEAGKTIDVLLDNLSDLILRCGFEKTYKFTRLLLEAISSSKTTAIFVFNPTAHDSEIVSSMRGLFHEQLAYSSSGPKVGTL